MLGRHAPAMASGGMILSRFWAMAPVAADLKVRVVVGAAVLKRNDVLDVPIISRRQLAPAHVAAPSACLENCGSTLRRHAAPAHVLETVSGHVFTVTMLGSFPPRTG